MTNHGLPIPAHWQRVTPKVRPVPTREELQARARRGRRTDARTLPCPTNYIPEGF